MAASVLLNTLTFAVYYNQEFADYTSPNVISYPGRPEVWCLYKCQIQVASAPTCYASHYDSSTATCYIVTGCGLVKLAGNSPDRTYVSALALSALLPSGLSVPMFEWMLTDACGYANTGFVRRGLVLQPIANNTAAGWTYSLITSPNKRLGNVLQFPGGWNYLFAAVVTPGLTLNFTTNSLTIFAYFLSNSTTNFFPMFEVGVLSNASYSFGPHFWFYNGLYYNFSKLSKNQKLSVKYSLFGPNEVRLKGFIVNLACNFVTKSSTGHAIAALEIK